MTAPIERLNQLNNGLTHNVPTSDATNRLFVAILVADGGFGTTRPLAGLTYNGKTFSHVGELNSDSESIDVWVIDDLPLAAGTYELTGSFDATPSTYRLAVYELQGYVLPHDAFATVFGYLAAPWTQDLVVNENSIAMTLCWTNVAATSYGDQIDLDPLGSTAGRGDVLVSYIESDSAQTLTVGWEYAGTTWNRTVMFAFPPGAAAVERDIFFDGIPAGSEIRVYEVPHAARWIVDFADLTPADMDGVGFTFQVQDDGSVSDHNLWFDLDDGSANPSLDGTAHEVDVSTGYDDSDIASAAQTVLDAISNISATVSGTEVTITGDYNGTVVAPADDELVGTGALFTIIQIGGTSTAEITGIESTTGDSWTGLYLVEHPRRAIITMMNLEYKFLRYQQVLPTAGLTVPAGAILSEDYVYSNPA
jgi:hypothetical protein